MKFIVALPIALAAVALAACGSAASSTPPAASTSVPPGQPGASAPPSAACLTAGTCTIAQQQQVASSEGITDAAGLNGCLVAGDCTAAEQEGIAAGTSAGNSSGQLPTSAPAPVTVSNTCIFGATGEDVEVQLSGYSDPCSTEESVLAGDGLSWYPIASLAAVGSNGTADDETMALTCTLTNGPETLTVEDAGGMDYGTQICSASEQAGWTNTS
jgi:hypothetical protein